MTPAIAHITETVRQGLLTTSGRGVPSLGMSTPQVLGEMMKEELTAKVGAMHAKVPGRRNEFAPRLPSGLWQRLTQASYALFDQRSTTGVPAGSVGCLPALDSGPEVCGG